MNGTTARTTFDRLLADEPPILLTLEPVVAAGRRHRRRRRVAYGCGVAASVAVVAVAVPLATRTGGDRLAVRRFTPPLRAAAPATVDALTPAQQAIADAIRDASPAGWTFDLAADRWDGARGVEATADDGAGPGRLLVGISTGTQLLHPCADAEFRQGATCEERGQADGSVLSLRGTVTFDGTAYTDVVLTHPDGSGISVESANFVLTWPLPTVTTERGKRDLLHVSRPDPTYTTEQLAAVVLAVDRAVR